ncbi:hypothetical protein [Streptomyces sp. NPDC040750]|uniref:hypothetical protein n=1 Tax=Streptomyces sp. NPDC040750 TaxID=3154491 RepID=UPI0033F0F4F3
MHRRPPSAASRGRTVPCPPAYALPPFHPGVRGATPGTAPASPAPRPPRPPRRSRCREVVDAAVSGVLLALCVTALLVAMTLAVVRTRG